MHKKLKEKLEQLREYYREGTQELLMIFSSVLGTIKPNDDINESMKVAHNTIKIVVKLKH